MQSINKVFDYRALRLLMGLIALSIPFVVTALAGSKELTSISASYYSDARDMFVGMLFIVGSFLFAYHGHSDSQSRNSKIAAVAAILVALFPTACDGCTANLISKIHFAAAITLFSILAYFCFVIFRKDTKGQPGKKGVRSKIYLTCGLIMVGCMVVMLASFVALSPEALDDSRIIFYGEAASLIAFGIAWIVSGKSLRLIAEPDDLFRPFAREER